MKINEDLFDKKYKQDDRQTFDELCKKVSNNEAQYEMFKNGEAILGGSHLRGRKGDGKFTLFNCYALAINDDSKKGISELESRSDEVSSRGGGIGVNFSMLRPRGATIGGNDKYASSGSISFMDRFAYSQSKITLGNSRRGALIGLLSVYHPDILEFISCKEKDGIMSNMNISLLADDAFMEAVVKDDFIDLYFPDYETIGREEYKNLWDGDLTNWLSNGYPIKKYDRIPARTIFDKVVIGAWKNGEPGFIFEDTVNNESPIMERIIATNPLTK